jgi:membrane AbrB-like protein
MIVTVLVGIAGGLLFVWLNIPAGGLFGSLFAVLAFNLATDSAKDLPRPVRILTGALMGTAVGSLVTRELVSQLGSSLIWAILFPVFIVAVGGVAGLLLARMTGMDRLTALLATIPGGISEIAFISEQLGAETETVLGVQLVRKVLVVLITAGVFVWVIG